MDLTSMSSYRTYIYFKNTNLASRKCYNLTYRLPKFKLPLSSSLFILSNILINFYSVHETNKLYVDIYTSDLYSQFLLPLLYEDLMFVN
jgi:hypothetical protein